VADEDVALRPRVDGVVAATDRAPVDRVAVADLQITAGHAEEEVAGTALGGPPAQRHLVANQGVLALCPAEDVVLATARDEVVAGAAADHVQATSPADSVVAALPKDDVIAAVADNHVGVIGPHDRVALPAAGDRRPLAEAMLGVGSGPDERWGEEAQDERHEAYRAEAASAHG